MAADFAEPESAALVWPLLLRAVQRSLTHAVRAAAVVDDHHGEARFRREDGADEVDQLLIRLVGR
jgi:hypothetical protein